MWVQYSRITGVLQVYKCYKTEHLAANGPKWAQNGIHEPVLRAITAVLQPKMGSFRSN